MASITVYPSSYDTTDYSYASVNTSYPLSNAVGKASNNTSYAQWNIKTGQNAESWVYYNFDLSQIPLDAVINSVTCSAKAYISSTNASRINTRTAQLYSGTTAKGSTSTISTSTTSFNINCGTWTREELNNCKIKIYTRRGTSSTTTTYTNRFYGASLTVDYSVSYTVRFLDHNGNVLKTEIVQDGDNATPPNDPTRTGYIFSGWNGSYNNIESDTDITATYKKAITNITLDESIEDISLGEEIHINAIFEPQDAEEELKWSINNSNVSFTTNSNKTMAIIVGLTEGSTIVTCSNQSESIIKTCTINISTEQQTYSVNNLRIGNYKNSNYRLGDKEVTRIFLGNNLVFEKPQTYVGRVTNDNIISLFNNLPTDEYTLRYENAGGIIDNFVKIASIQHEFVEVEDYTYGRVTDDNTIELANSLPSDIYTLRFINEDGNPIENFSDICDLEHTQQIEEDHTYGNVSDNNTISLSNNLPSGTYTLKYLDNDENLIANFSDIATITHSGGAN